MSCANDDAKKLPADGRVVTPAAEERGLTPQLSEAQNAELSSLKDALATVQNLDAAGFATKYAVPFASGPLAYDPLSAANLSLIEASSIGVGSKQSLKQRGFAVLPDKRFPSFAYGYHTIYAEDLPVFISADSILFAVHHSFSSILTNTERTTLVPALERMLVAMRSALASGATSGFASDVTRDVDVYLAVALSLVTGQEQPPVIGSSATSIHTLYELAVAAGTPADVDLFGTRRAVDFSQFKPRGHYAGDVQLEQYFRATMWLGRVEMRMLETLPNHTQRFNRRQLEGAFALRAAMNTEALGAWRMIDKVVGGFIGEHDDMVVTELDALLQQLGLASASTLGDRTDAQIADAIIQGGFGMQRIASQIMVNGLDSGTLDLSRTFVLLGQRYVLDSHVFSNVVYDRVQRGSVKRMMPNPLDVAFAALKNDHAGQLLAPELQQYAYASDLASMRILADAHADSFWHANVYNEWLGAIRALSPTSDVASSTSGLPEVARTQAWGRRLLQTQLGSWAELRHDTNLYAKQSYTTVAACEYPDAYIDPYPEFFARIGSLASRAASVLSSAGIQASAWNDAYVAYFNGVQSVAAILERMARNQRAGTPHSAEDLAFVNKLLFVEVDAVCTKVRQLDGWYAKLFVENSELEKANPVIADVHTQPSDESGNLVGKVLHVATSLPRAMVVTVDSCNGPRAYVGLVSDYQEMITSNFERKTDQEWAPTQNVAPPEVPWVSEIVK